MNSLRSGLKQILPGPAIRIMREGWDAIDRLRSWPEATFHPWRRDSIRRIEALRDTKKGERCFIIGNGPSLRSTDMSRLRSENTIGMNRIYLMFEEIGFQTTYYLSINDLVIEQCASDIQELKMPRFVAWRSRKWLQPEDNLFFLYTTYTGRKFGRNAAGRLWEGATVTYTALQVAYFLGFQEVILVGVDHNFSTKGTPNTTIVSQGDDPNHFSPAYFGKGFRWQLPDLETSEEAYVMARQAYEGAGRRILDATIGGKLEVFSKVEYSSLF